MEFNKRYSRSEFINFLQHKFLPEDFIAETTVVDIERQTKYIRSVTKLGSSESLDLVVYEIRHTSTHDARVGLSKEAFRFLADEWESKALVLFVPEVNDVNYRFSLITIDLNETEEGKLQKIYSNPRRYSYYLGEGIAYYTPNKYLNAGRVTDEKDLTDRFSVEELTKAFYQELSDWYAWAVKIVRFPNKLDDKNDDDKYNSEAAIRLVTRLIFVWFLKQKHLIPNEFFDEDYIRENLIDGFNPNVMVDLFSKSNESKYYKAILQNLFFAMLNSPITKEGESELSERHFRSGRGDYDNNKLMRYESMFKNPQLFIDLANKTVPFLNGGLFDCLDDKDNGNYVDGFSDREVVKRTLIVPDYLFFGEEVGKDIDLSEWYGDKKKKKVSARGIIDILKRYNFTVEENTPFDQEVSLDPELLGKVFENLLASYNPETQTTARKQTGSFYTPREIVQYMVDESLIAHLKRTVGEGLEAEYRKLISYVDEEISLTAEQKLQVMESIYHCKVLDPACGSGAFPVGMLQQMVHILSQLDPTNEQWKKMMLDEAVNESRNAFQAESKEEREERLLDIENSFDENLNNPDYARKLYLIENCIYGVDIQPIAIQISKLRFFISLVVDQKANNDPIKNFGIRPLPNLEAKFVAANSLIPLAKQEDSLGRTPDIITLENKLKEANHKIFSAKTVRTKRKWKTILIELRTEMAEKLAENGFLTSSAANQIASWDMFNQNSAASFFDADWMFGIKDGFDIVIANPPYIDSETMERTMPEMRRIYRELYSTASGNWDMFIVFIEKGNRLLKNNGVQSYIVPNKLVAAKYADALRSFMAQQNIFIIRDYGSVPVFEAFVYPCVFVLSKQVNDKPVKFETMLNLSNIDSSHIVDRKIFNRDTLWDKYFIDTDKLNIILSVSSHKCLSEVVSQICGSATVAEAYLVKEVLIDEYKNGNLKFINTGTIDKYTSLWSIRDTQYIKGRYHTPSISKTSLQHISDRRLAQSVSNKIIVAGMSKEIEAYYDEGEYLAGKSTTIILDDSTKLKLIYAILNSKLLTFWLRINFNSLKMSGGFINVGVNELSQIPIADCESIKNNIVDLIDLIIVSKKTSPQANTSDLENRIDSLVYKLYNLTYDEVLIVDPETPITREEYENISN
jgi:hypothetical protein